MSHYPLISIILIGSCTLEQLERCLEELRGIDYPKDQLEYFLILPPQRPHPQNGNKILGLKTIQFDTTLQWDEVSARMEGISLANGEFVQMLNAGYALQGDWFKKALPHFLHHQIFGIRGRVEPFDAEQGLREGNPSENIEFVLDDGLYDRKIIRYLQLRKEWLSRSMKDYFPLPEKILFLPMTMARMTQASRFYQHNEPSLFGRGLRKIFKILTLVKDY